MLEELFNSILIQFGSAPVIILVGISMFMLSYNASDKIFDWLREQSIGTRDYVQKKLDLIFINITSNQLMIFLITGSFGVGLVVFMIFGIFKLWFHAVLFSLIFTYLGWKAPRFIIDYLFDRRMTLFNYQLVDGLALMANGLRSGLSVQQSLELVVHELPNPISQEFNLIMNQMKLGVSLEEAFMNLAKRIPGEDIQMFVTAVVILKETGGNLAEAFETIVFTVRERIKVQKKINAMTAMGKMQGATLFFIPIILALGLTITDPEMMMPMYKTPIGLIGLLAILGLQLIGGWVVLKVTKINV